MTTVQIDTYNAAATYRQLKGSPDALVDSVYEMVCDALKNEGRFPLLFAHLEFYQKRRGNNPRVAALKSLVNGYYYSGKAMADSGDLFFGQAVSGYQQLNMPAAEADAYSGLIGNALFRNDYKAALALQYKALRIYEQLHDSVSIYAVRGHMAVIYEHLGDADQAVSLLKQSLHYYERTGNRKEKAHTDLSLASRYHKLYNYEQSLFHIEAALPVFEKLQSMGEIARAKNLLGTIYSEQKNWRKANQCFYQSRALVQDKRQIPYIDFNLAANYSSMGLRDSALSIYRSLLANASSDRKLIAGTHLSLSQHYELAQQYNAALLHYKAYKRLSDSVYSAERTQSLHELNLRYEAEKSSAAIHQLRAEQQAERLRKTTYLLGWILTMVLGASIVFLLRQRNKKHKQRLRQVEAALLSNQEELRLFTEKFLSKNKLVEEMEARVKVLEVQAIAGNETEQLSALYQFKILTDEDWREFKILFDKVHPGLIGKLRSRYPDLAPAEERQFLLIRLNIDNKESADMLGISVPGVKKNRYRLKKRFGLDEPDDLDAFVKTF